MTKEGNQQVRVEKLISIISLENTAAFTEPITLRRNSFRIAMLVLEM